VSVPIQLINGKRESESSATRARVALVTLGCAKNLVDSEIMAGLMAKGNFTTTSDPADADVALANTCAFIGP